MSQILEKERKKMKKKLLGIVLVVVLVLGLGFVYSQFSEKPVEGSKAITIEVVDNDEKSTVYELNTDAEYLREAMDEVEELTYDGEDSDYGFTVYTVNGVTADYNTDGAYWGFYVNEEYCNYGIDQQPVNDQDAFQIVYTIYE